MQYFHKKSVIFGIGIGIIVTSIAALFYLMAEYPAGYVAKDDTAAYQSGTGTVSESNTGSSTSAVPTVKKTDTSTSGKSNDTADKADASNDKNKSTADKEAADKEMISITIVTGDTSASVSEKLYRAGLVANKDEFENYLVDKGLDASIKIGEFKIAMGSGIDVISGVITGSGN